MAGNVDTRIIQIQFENREFEKNIAKSQKSIEDLKEAMDFEETSRGLEKFADSTKVLGFDSLAANVEKLMNKFTGLGTVSEYVLSRIRNMAENAALSMERFIRSISIDQIGIGENKYNAMNKAVMTIVSGGQATEDEAYETMERVIAYTDQTSHSFDTMVARISDLTSKGMGLDEAERMIEAMGNAATYAGQGAQEAAMSMGVISKAMSGQFLGYEQYLQLANTSKVITAKWKEQAIEAALAVGTLEKKQDKYYTKVKGQKAVEVSVGNLENTLRSRWLTSEVLKKIYENYMFGNTTDELAHPEKALDSFGKTAYLTGQRALTLVDALNAIKESVSSGWMESFRHIWGDVSEAAEHFTNICNRIIDSLDQIRQFRNDVLASWAAIGGRDSFLSLLLGSYGSEDELNSELVGFMDLIDRAGKIIYEGFTDFIGLFAGPASRELIKEDPQYLKSYLGAMLKSITDSIQEFLQGIRDFFEGEVEVNGQVRTRLNIIQDVVKGIAGALKMALDLLDGVQTFILTIGSQLTPGFDSVLVFLGKLGEEIYLTAQETGDAGTIKKFFNDLAETLKPVTDGINSIVTAITNFLTVLLGLDDESKDRTETFTKIGNVLLTIADVVAKIAGPILDFIASIINAVTELFKGGVTPEKFEAFGKSLSDGFTTMMKSFADNLPDSFGFLGNWIRDLFGLWEDEAGQQRNTFFSFLHKLFTGEFGSLGEMIHSLLNGFSLKDALESGFGFLSAFNFLNQVIGFFKGTNLYGVIMAFLGVATLAGLLGLIRKAKVGVSVVSGFFSDVGGNLRSFGTSFKQGFLGDYEWFGERVLNLAKAIGILVGCVFVLGSMKTEGMVQGIIGLIVVIGAMAGLFAVMSLLKANYIQQTTAAALMTSIAAVVVAITIGLSILSLAILPLASDWRKMLAAVLGLIGMLAAIGFFIVLVVKGLQAIMNIHYYELPKEKWKKIGQLAIIIGLLCVAIIAISFAISTLAVALTPLALTGWEGMLRAIIAFGAFLTIFGVFFVVMINQLDTLAFKIGGGTGFAGYGKMAIALLALSASITLISIGIGVLAAALTPLALMSWGGWIRAIAGLGLILLELGAMITFVANLTTADKAATLKIAGMAGFAIGLGILIFALTPLALMTDKAMVRAVTGLGAILLEMALMIGFVTGMTTADKSATLKIAGMARFCASLAILIFALTPLAGMELQGYLQAILGLGAILLEIALFMGIMRMAKIEPVDMGGFLWFALGLAALILAITPLGNMSPQGYMQAIIGLGAIMLEVIVLMKIMEEVRPDLKQAGATLLLLLGFAAAMLLFSIALNEVKDVPWPVIAAFAVGMALIIGAIGVAAKAGSALSIKGILMISLAIAAVLGVFALMIPLLMNAVGSSLSGFASRLAMFAELLSIFSDKMNNVDAGSIDKFKGILGALNEALRIMLKVTVDDGKIRSYMTAIASMNLITGQLKIFQERIGGFNPTSIEKLKLTLQKLNDVLGNEIKSISTYTGIASLFSDAMYNLGTGIEIFNNHTGDVGNVEDNSAIQLIQALSGCADDMKTIYDMDLGRITSQMSGLGGALMLYAKGAAEATDVTGFDPSDESSISAISAAVKIMQAITTAFAEEGGAVIPENMPSSDEFGLFGAQLAALAAALIEFEGAGQGLGDGTEEALETLTFFQQLKQKLHDTGFTQNVQDAMNAFKDANGNVIAQTSELETFGKNIEQLGLSLGQFAQSTQQQDAVTKEMKPIDYTMATKALDSIVEMGNKLPNVGGVVSKIVGEKVRIGELAAEIELLGTAMGDLYRETSDFDNKTGKYTPYDFGNQIEFLNCIKGLSEKMPHIGGINLRRLWEGDQMTFAQLGQDLGELGSGLNTMSEAITGKNKDGNDKFDPDKATQATNLLSEHVIPMMTTLGRDLPKVGGLGQIWKTLGEGRDTNMEDVANAMEQLGRGLGALGKGIGDGGWESNTAIQNAFAALESIFGVFAKIQELLVTNNNLFENEGIGIASFRIFEALSEFLNDMTVGGEDFVTGDTYGPIFDKIKAFTGGISDAFGDLAKTAGGIESLEGRLNIFRIMAEAINAMSNANFTGDWSQIGTNLTGQVAKAITDGAEGVINAAKNLFINAYAEAGSIDGVDWYALGVNIGTGITNGVNYAGPQFVTPAVKQMMVDAYNAGKAAIDSNSPSKLFMTLGNFISQGLGIGIDEDSGEASDAAEKMAKGTLEPVQAMADTLNNSDLLQHMKMNLMQSALQINEHLKSILSKKGFDTSMIDELSNRIAAIANTMSEESAAFEPTITPVLDLSQVEAGLDNAFGANAQNRYTIGLDTSLGAAIAGALAQNDQPTYDFNQLKPDYTGLYAKMDALGQQVNSLGKAIGNIKIILNSGVVAGGITDDVDRNLGRKIFYAGRNN